MLRHDILHQTASFPPGVQANPPLRENVFQEQLDDTATHSRRFWFQRDYCSTSQSHDIHLATDFYFTDTLIILA